MEQDDRLQHYAEAWGELRDLIKTEGWEHFADRVAYELDIHQRRVMSGRLDPADYQRECGILLGLQLALTVPDRVKQEYDTLLGQEAEQVAGQNGQMEIPA